MEAMKRVEKRVEIQHTTQGVPYTVTGKTCGQLTVNLGEETKKGNFIPRMSTIVRVKNRKDFDEDMRYGLVLKNQSLLQAWQFKMTDAEIQEIRKKYSDPNYLNFALERVVDKLASAIVETNILDRVEESLLKQRREYISEKAEADLKVLSYKEFHKKYKDITMNRMYNLGYKIKHGKYYLP